MELKDRLYQALIDNPMSVKKVSDEIGVSVIMLGKYLKTDDHNLSFKSRLLIEKWLKDKELE